MGKEKEHFHRRKHLYIDPNLQKEWMKLVGKISVFGILFGVGGLLIIPVIVQAFSKHRTFGDIGVGATILSVWPWMILSMLIYLGACLLMGLFYSHRVAGPLHRIQNKIKARINGERIEVVKIREKDYFQELAKLIGNLFQSELALEDSSRNLVKQLESMSNNDTKQNPEILEAIERVKLSLKSNASESSKDSSPLVPPKSSF